MAKSKDNGWHEYHGGQTFSVPWSMLQHPNFTRLTPHACKLLFDLGKQFGGHNNGYLFAGWEHMSKSGWKSQTTLRNAILELRHYRLLILTRQGGRNRASYYGFTWRSIAEKKGKPLDCGVTCSRPTDAWLTEVPAFVPPPKRKGADEKSLHLSVEKPAPPRGVVRRKLVHLVEQQITTTPPSGAVSHFPPSPLHLSVNSIKGMPYPVGAVGSAASCGALDADGPAVSPVGAFDPAPSSDSRLGNNRRPNVDRKRASA